MTPLSTCIVCDATAWTPLYRGLVRCAGCGFVRAEELPEPDDLVRLYGPEYFQGEEYADYLGDEPAHVKNFRNRFARITSVAGKLESMFEIGCAYGLWLRTAAEHGVRVAGIDISSEAVRYATETLKLNATAGGFEDVEIAPGEFQAYCMWDTLEHLSHPETYVGRIAGLLPPAGWLFLTTGDIDSPLARRQGERWRMIHPPTHLQYFSRETVTRLLARHGLDVTCIESTAICRSLHGTLEGLKRFGAGPLRTGARAAASLVPGAITRRMRFSVDLGDIMLVCAQRPGRLASSPTVTGRH